MKKYWRFSVIFSLIFLGKLSGFIKDVLMTFYHGVSKITDAYFLSNSISSVLFMAVYSAIPIIVVPLYSRLIIDHSRLRVNHDLSAALFFFFFISICISGSVVFSANWLVERFSGEIDEEVKSLAVRYLSIMAFTYVLSTLVSFFNSLQTVNKVVVPSYIVPVTNNLAFCIGLYFFSSAANFDRVLMLGVLAWLVLFLFNYFISRNSFVFYPRNAFSFFINKKFILLFFPAVLSFYIEQLNGFVGVYFATQLGVGSISVFGYSNKLNMVFLSVFLVFLTASIFPKIAVVTASNKQSDLLLYLNKCVRLVLILSIPLVIYMNFYSEEIVALLFQRGKFKGDDVEKVAFIFSIILIALPFSLIRDVMNRVFFSHGNTTTPVLVSSLTLLLNFALSFILYQQYGLMGLASSTVITTIVNSLAVTFLVQIKIQRELFRSYARIFMACCLCGSAAYLSLKWLDLFFSYYWLLLFTPYVLVYILCLFLLRVKEVDIIFNFMKKRKIG